MTQVPGTYPTEAEAIAAAKREIDLIIAIREAIKDAYWDGYASMHLGGEMLAPDFDNLAQAAIKAMREFKG